MQAGPELDRKVADIIGLTGYGCACGPAENGYDGDTGKCNRCGERIPPRFSTDANDALLAAEKFELFDEWLMAKHHTGWYFQNHSEIPLSGVLGTTPSHAICLAIVLLAGDDQ